MESYQYAPSLQFEQSGDLENSRQERAVKWLDIFIVAALYFGTAKLGQFFAIAPGNVTPVWIPSGIILAATLLKGYRIWPGIFLGAFLGNVSSYSTLPSDIGILNVLFAGIANGIGDSLCALVSAFLIFRCTKGRHPFHRLNHISHFIFSGALIGPLISALFGVTGLALTGLLSWSEYSTVFQTWWTGDGVGVLIITPLILSWIKKLQDSGTGNIFRIEDLFYTLILATLCFFSFGFADDHHYMHMSMFAILSLCMWAIFRLEPHVTHLSGLILASSAIIYTVLDVEWLHGHDFNAALIELQLMVALTSITILVLHSMFCEKEIAEKSLDYLAHHDPLTNLPNRLFFKEKLRRNIKSSKIRQSSFAVVFIDLDHFKAVNDTFGHPIGDELLKSVSIRLKNAIRSDDNIARISGDEFVLLLEDIRNDKDIHIMMEKLLAIFSEPFHLQEHKLYASASIGASIFPQHGTAIAELMKNADIAMYSAKHHGRNTYQIFTEELIAETLHNSKIDHAMRSALHDQEFYLVYQPQFNLDTNKITGVEVLLRWVSADIGFISPGVFIPIAEHNG